MRRERGVESGFDCLGRGLVRDRRSEVAQSSNGTADGKMGSALSAFTFIFSLLPFTSRRLLKASLANASPAPGNSYLSPSETKWGGPRVPSS